MYLPIVISIVFGEHELAHKYINVHKPSTLHYLIDLLEFRRIKYQNNSTH